MVHRHLLACAAVLGVAAVGFVVFAMTHRPDNPVEAELLFEALRVARGHALYVDPSIGAWEDGAPPSRYFVLYTPIWPWLLGHLARPDLESLRLSGRSIAALSWLGIFFAPTRAADSARRPLVHTAALLGLAVYFLARSGPNATPDTLAVCLAAFGLARIAKQGRLDGVAAALLAVAPLVKPSCLGVAAGVGLALVITRDRRAWRALVAGGAAFAVVAVFCHVVSDGHWLAHIVRSTRQPLTFARFADELGVRFFVLGAPHLVVLAVAVRRRAPLLVVMPLLTSIMWSSFSMAKYGSGTNYWLEPTMAALVTLAVLPRARAWAHWRWPASVLAASIAITSVPAYVGELERWIERRDELALLDAHCTRRPGEVVVSSEAAIELALDGRLLVPDWQSSFLARAGAFPLEEWQRDLLRPEVRWVVLPFDPDEPDPVHADAVVERSAFRDLLRPSLDAGMVRDGRIGRFHVFRRRGEDELALRPDTP